MNEGRVLKIGHDRLHSHILLFVIQNKPTFEFFGQQCRQVTQDSINTFSQIPREKKKSKKKIERTSNWVNVL